MRKLIAKWGVETVEEFLEELRPEKPYSPDLIHYWTTFLMHADMLCSHVVHLKRKKNKA